MGYLESFEEHYRRFFSALSLCELVQFYHGLSKILDDDICSSVLTDEVLLLYDLIRDECVRRVSRMADFLGDCRCLK
ncbi:hypothetical protein [Lachnoclostridium sp. An14]|uniref:hypothetical protein n=1 Tax=Lachnoclostridium sp. An14 TaxID=1965562 RepID=UPI00117B54DC|nr:hypothetical protein [Lachnoclostridium sp. An14]